MVSFEELKNKKEAIVVVGLGYVGLPLALALAKKFKVIGFDIKQSRIDQLKQNIDNTGEISTEEITKAVNIEYTYEPQKIKRGKCIIIAVPTPVDEGNIPDFSLLKKASQLVGENLNNKSVVVYESTVYPGATEEICLPILERFSKSKCGIDFSIGYSPERINPGDKEHAIDKIIKVVSGFDEETTKLLNDIYGSITQTFKASSIKVAEAAKVIENTQRDLNIALMNELAIIFKKMNISIYDVLEAANTKWNFLKFYPGLVGGHCIGVDPYYLTYKAQVLGYHPEVILSGRKINDSMAKWIVSEIVKRTIRGKKNILELKVLLCGITFKENVSDIRNSKVVNIYKELVEYGYKPNVYDPIANKEEVKKEYSIELLETTQDKKFDIIIIATAHNQFKIMSLQEWKKSLTDEDALLVDIKGIINKKDLKKNIVNYWTL